jgi:hypothetical protein
MYALLCFILAVLALPFKSKSRLEAENAALRHQLIVLRRKVHGRVRLTNCDRWFFTQLYRWSPSILTVLTIIRPETLVRWHRAGFRHFSNRPVGVKHFQTIHRCGVDVAHGLALLFGIGTKALVWGFFSQEV